MDIRGLIGVCALLAGAAVQAHEGDPTYDRVSLTVSAEREVDNDTLVATMFIEHQAQRQQEVANVVNEGMQWALARAKKAAGIKVQTTNYNNSPVYTKRVITGWRARQSLRLESGNPEQLSELIGELQEKLSIGSLDYTVSKLARDAASEDLTRDALAAFRQRAELVTRELGRGSYRIVQLNIDNQDGQQPRVAYAARAADMEAAMAPPAVEAGVQTLGVNVYGTIEVDAGAPGAR